MGSNSHKCLASLGEISKTSQTVRVMLLANLSSIAVVSPAAAQTRSAPATATAEPADPPAIIVTGTRRTDRTVADSPVPIDVIGSEAITNTGATETNKILNQLVPSFNFPQPAIADGSDALRPATLRGLSPDQTLVLINGKRAATCRRCSTSTAPSGAAARRSTLTLSRASRSVESKCCATVRRRNMAPMRLPG